MICPRCQGKMRVIDPEPLEPPINEDGMIPCPDCEGEGEITLDEDEMRGILENYWEDYNNIEEFMTDHYQNLNSYEKNLADFKEIYEV